MPVTTAGTEVENFIEYALERKGYNVETQVASSGINQEWSRIDIVLLGNPQQAISLKYQDVAGTAEEKLLYEAHNLSLMCYAHNYRGTIVLCGYGWSPVKYNWFLNVYRPPVNVRIIDYDSFVQEYILK